MNTTEKLNSVDPEASLDFDGYPDEQYQLDVYLASTDCVADINLSACSILDIGCGSGKFPILLSKLYPETFQSISYTGIDRNPNAINHAKEYVWKNYTSNNVNFLTADILDWNTETTFDWCFMNSLFHIQEQEDMVTYLHAVVDLVFTKFCNKGLAFNFYWPIGQDTAVAEYKLGDLVEFMIRKYKKVLVKSDYATGESFIFIYKP